MTTQITLLLVVYIKGKGSGIVCSQSSIHNSQASIYCKNNEQIFKNGGNQAIHATSTFEYVFNSIESFGFNYSILKQAQQIEQESGTLMQILDTGEHTLGSEQLYSCLIQPLYTVHL